MDKADFIAKVHNHLLFLLETEERTFKKKIEGRRERMDETRFRQWLEQTENEVQESAALQSFEQVQKRWMGTIKAAAAEIAGTIEFNNRAKRRFKPGSTPPLDWQEVWREVWGIRFVRNYVEALKAEKQIELIEQYLNDPPLTFERLFVNNAALDTAVKSIVGTAFTARKKPHLRAFFLAARNVGLLQKRVVEYKALPLIAEYFEETCGPNAAYQAKIDEQLVDVLTRKMMPEKS